MEDGARENFSRALATMLTTLRDTSLIINHYLYRLGLLQRDQRRTSHFFFQIMGMRLPVNNAPAKKSIGLSLSWHSSTILRRSFEARKNSLRALATIPLTLRDTP